MRLTRLFSEGIYVILVIHLLEPLTIDFHYFSHWTCRMFSSIQIEYQLSHPSNTKYLTVLSSEQTRWATCILKEKVPCIWCREQLAQTTLWEMRQLFLRMCQGNVRIPVTSKYWIDSYPSYANEISEKSKKERKHFRVAIKSLRFRYKVGTIPTDGIHGLPWPLGNDRISRSFVVTIPTGCLIMQATLKQCRIASGGWQANSAHLGRLISLFYLCSLADVLLLMLWLSHE